MIGLCNGTSKASPLATPGREKTSRLIKYEMYRKIAEFFFCRMEKISRYSFILWVRLTLKQTLIILTI